jgi:hypothetical protein
MRAPAVADTANDTMQLRSRESLVQHACEQAIRSRLHELDDHPTERTATKRSSLRLLALALHDDRLDEVQLLHLQQLVDQYEQHLLAHPLPVWPGAEAQQLRADADELVSIGVAREWLLEQRHRR